MKKIYIAMAVIATAALASCQQEKSFNDVKLGENSVVFAIKSNSTRSAEVTSETRQGIVIPLETEDGTRFVLEETVTNLDAFFPETKGAPAYTENLGMLYANDLSVYAAEGTFGTATFWNMENSQYPRKDADLGKGWRYNYNYNGDPWPGETETVGFYLNMPATPTNVTFVTPGGRTGGKFTFTYTSPEKAADQQDILFAYRATNKSEYFDYFHPNGIPVLFNHALTAVKFAIGNGDTDISDNAIKITKITFKDLVNTGTCEITPGSEGNYKDNPTNYSSAGAAQWKDTTVTKGNTITSDIINGTVSYTSGENNKFGDSWYSAGNNKNLNNADATQTFWLIPQTFDPATSTTTLTIEYTFDGKSDSWEIKDFGKLLNGANWKAGELRTLTIKVDEVNVMIDDQVSIAGNKDNGYTGSEKTDVIITNTGNTDAYIRAAIVGQWLDNAENPVFGFTDEVFQLNEVDSWYMDQFVHSVHKQGTFTGLVGYVTTSGTTASDYWVKGADGYYYYIYVVPAKSEEITTQGTIPGDYIDPETGDLIIATEAQKAKQPLFTSYEIGEAPIVRISDKNTDIHFELEIATQAVSAMKTKGSYMTWMEAWQKALGYDPTITNPVAE